jgi:glutathione peroxidase
VPQSIYQFEATTIDGQPLKLEAFRGQVLLIVNVASRCSFTRQYAGLENLYHRHKDKGFAILGFPCNQFGHQEPGDEAAIKNFCAMTYNVSFPMFKKIDVNGQEAHPLYKFLKSARRGTLWTRFIKWNFTKFLIGRNGEVLRRFGPVATPRRIDKWIGPLLDQPANADAIMSGNNS